MKKYIFLAVIGLAAWACSPESDSDVTGRSETPTLPASTFSYSEDIPFEAKSGPLEANSVVTNHGATLGRVLFYDSKLSKNNSISCGSCHVQEFGFADPRPVSSGFENRITTRNSPPIANVKMFTGLFWDERASKLEEQVLMPVENHIEMGMEDMDDLAAKLSGVSYYQDLFRQAFGDADVSKDRIASALSQYLQSMVSFDSKFDQGEQNGFRNFTQLENEGRDLFFNQLHCARCHGGSNFANAGAANIGLELEYKDEGAKLITGKSQESGWFKIPSLRNIGLTAPYMHDGRFATLADVIEFYSDNVQPHEFLDIRMIRPRDGNNIVVSPTGGSSVYGGGGSVVDPRNSSTNNSSTALAKLSSSEKRALIAFLHTLTDPHYTTDPKFSDPFVIED